jgi:tRNA-dihydrouridine synthase B
VEPENEPIGAGSFSQDLERAILRNQPLIEFTEKYKKYSEQSMDQDNHQANLTETKPIELDGKITDDNQENTIKKPIENKNQNTHDNKELIVGKLHLKSKFILAPMEGVSDIGFRALCARNGAGITYTEMVRASGIVRNNKATLDLIDTYDPSTPTGLQLFAVNERELGVALYNLEKLADTTHPHFKNIIAIDLNFGCPSPDIIRIGAGPALLKRANKMRIMFDKLAFWRSTTKLPIQAISAKIRLGLNQQEQDHKIYLRLVESANEHLDFLIVHARHAKQKSSDQPSWNAIAEIKELAKIPIIGNGNVLGAKDAARMLEKTSCDGFMIARGAIEDPWVFYALNGIDNSPTKEEVIAARDEYFAISKKYNTKQKYIDFHKDNFEKILKRFD